MIILFIRLFSRKNKKSIFLILLSFSICASATAGWEKRTYVDDFSDKQLIRYFSTAKKERGGDGMHLLLDCNEEKVIDFSWQISDSSILKAPWDGIKLNVAIRIDSGQVFEEHWNWTEYGSFIKPDIEYKFDSLIFLRKLKGAKKLALKVLPSQKFSGSDVFPEIVGVFDISGFDKVYGEVTRSCGLFIKTQ
jgi:hypothetical protein